MNTFSLKNQFMAGKNLMRFFSSEDAVRVHVSHTDLDGYGCQIITMLMADNKVPISYINIPQPSDLNGVIKTIVTGQHPDARWIPQQKPMFLLITDLADLDPTIVDGVENLYYVYIDHHINNNLDKLTADSAFRFEAGEPYLVSTEPIFEKDKYHDAAATELYWKMIHYVIRLATSDEVDNGKGSVILNDPEPNGCMLPDVPSHILESVGQFVSLVSTYDTGNWGNWDTSMNYIPDEIKLQFLFNYYRIDRRSFIKMMIEFLSHENYKAAYAKGIAECKDIIDQEIGVLDAAYKKFISNIETIHERRSMDLGMFRGTLKLIMDDPVVYIRYIQHDDDEMIQHFSLIAKKVLEENHNINFVVYVNHVRMNVELRSRKGTDNNCFKLARANGGGGHFNAAGFPIGPSQH